MREMRQSDCIGSPWFSEASTVAYEACVGLQSLFADASAKLCTTPHQKIEVVMVEGDAAKPFSSSEGGGCSSPAHPAGAVGVQVLCNPVLYDKLIAFQF